MSEQQNNRPKRKYGWVDKQAKMTGDRAMIDSKVYNTYIIYEKGGELVKEYPNGDIMPLDKLDKDDKP